MFLGGIERNQRQAYKFIQKDTLAQVFSSEFCEIFKSTSSAEQLRTAASEKAFHSHVCEFLNTT